MATSVPKQKILIYLKWIITLLIPGVVLLTPSNELYTWEMHQFLAIVIFCIMCIAFEFFNIMIPALLMSMGFMACNLAPLEIIFGGWANTLPYQVIGAFVLANVLEETGLLKRVAYWTMLKTGGTYRGIVFGVWLAAILASFMTSCNAFVVIATLCYGICKSLNLKASPETTVIFTAGIMGSITAWIMIYFPAQMPFLITAGQSINPDFNITWLEFLFDNAPYFLISIITLWVLTKIMKPAQLIQGKTAIKEMYDSLAPISISEKKSSIIVLGILLFLITGNFHKINLAWGLMFGPWLLYMPGINVGTKKAIDNINFGLIFFIIACMSIGNISNYLGFSTLMSNLVVPILQNLSGTVVLIFFGLFAAVLNFVLTPMAILGAFTQPFAQIAVDLGINLKGALYALYWGTDQILLPHEINAVLIFFSFGLMPMGQFVKTFFIKFCVFFVGFLLIMLPWWHLIGVLSFI